MQGADAHHGRRTLDLAGPTGVHRRVDAVEGERVGGQAGVPIGQPDALAQRSPRPAAVASNFYCGRLGEQRRRAAIVQADLARETRHGQRHVMAGVGRAVAGEVDHDERLVGALEAYDDRLDCLEAIFQREADGAQRPGVRRPHGEAIAAAFDVGAQAQTHVVQRHVAEARRIGGDPHVEPSTERRRRAREVGLGVFDGERRAGERKGGHRDREARRVEPANGAARIDLGGDVEIGLDHRAFGLCQAGATRGPHPDGVIFSASTQAQRRATAAADIERDRFAAQQPRRADRLKDRGVELRGSEVQPFGPGQGGRGARHLDRGFALHRDARGDAR